MIYKIVNFTIGLGAINMVPEDICMGPLLCRSRNGECCPLELIGGRSLCPTSCNIADRQTDVADGQVQQGITLQDIFTVTFLSSTIYNTFRSLLTTVTTVTTTTTTTTATTTVSTTTAPTITSSMLILFGCCLVTRPKAYRCNKPQDPCHCCLSF